MRINHIDWYPCYLNPSFDEVVELAKSSWDTCRILVNNENGDLIIASGYGNTHESISKLYSDHLKKKRRPCTDSFILYHSNRVAFMNLEDVSGSQRARLEDWPFDEPHLSVIKDLVRESDLAL